MMDIHTVICTHPFLCRNVPDLEENGTFTYFYNFSGESRPGMEEKERREKLRKEDEEWRVEGRGETTKGEEKKRNGRRGTRER